LVLPTRLWHFNFLAVIAEYYIVDIDLTAHELQCSLPLNDGQKYNPAQYQ